MDYNNFEKSIRKSKIFAVYVVSGDETFLTKQSLFIIKEKVLDKADADLMLAEYFGKDVTFGQIFDELRTVSLFGMESKRLIIIEDADDFLKKYKKKAQAYFLSPSPYACLVLVCNNVETWVKKITDNKWVTVECEKLRSRKLPSWIVARAEKFKKRLTPEASKVLMEETGNDLELIENHIIKLITYVGDREMINVEDVHAITFDAKKQSIFELTDAMANKNTVNALKILKRLITSGEDFTMIISLLGWQVRRLWMAKRIINDCRNNNLTIAKRFQDELKVNRYFFNGFLKQAKLFSEEGLQEKFSYITDADVNIKTSSLEPRIIVECLLIKLCK